MLMSFANLKKSVMNSGKGTFHSMVWEHTCKTLKAFSGYNITKRSYGVVRFGVEYDNMKAVQSKRESGELPSVNAGLTWGTWSEYPYFIAHKGNTYLRCALSKNNKIRTEYYVNGVKTDKEKVLHMLQASEKKPTNQLDVFSVNVENIISIK